MPRRWTRRGLLGRGASFYGKVGLRQNAKREGARLGALDFDALAGLESGPLQPVPGEPDSRFDLPLGEIPGFFNLEGAGVHDATSLSSASFSPRMKSAAFCAWAAA